MEKLPFDFARLKECPVSAPEYYVPYICIRSFEGGINDHKKEQFEFALRIDFFVQFFNHVSANFNAIKESSGKVWKVNGHGYITMTCHSGRTITTHCNICQSEVSVESNNITFRLRYKKENYIHRIVCHEGCLKNLFKVTENISNHYQQEIVRFCF